MYLDTSAAMKLVRPELQSEALSQWLSERDRSSVLSSVLIEVELLRATRRSAPAAMHRAVEVLGGVGTVTLSAAVIARAGAYTDPDLRSLDAIHLATAEHVAALTNEPLEAFVAYDRRLLAAARLCGLPVASPGMI
jgi:predicted nucleic acid-binding protein